MTKEALKKAIETAKKHNKENGKTYFVLDKEGGAGVIVEESHYNPNHIGMKDRKIVAIIK